MFKTEWKKFYRKIKEKINNTGHLNENKKEILEFWKNIWGRKNNIDLNIQNVININSNYGIEMNYKLKKKLSSK